MVLLLDNFDSFTYNLVDYFSQQGIICKVFRNDTPITEIKKLTFKGIVLSPGPGIPKTSGNMMEVIEYYYEKLPIMGICLGHQALGEFFGAKLIKAPTPMHGKVSEIIVKNDPLLENIPERFKVVRYHSLVLSEVPNNLEVIGSTLNGEIMIIKSKNYPCYGIQYHPEAHLTEYGHKIIGNWIKIHKIMTG